MIFINLDSFPLPSAEKEGVEKEDSEGKTVGVKVRNETLDRRLRSLGYGGF